MMANPTERRSKLLATIIKDLVVQTYISEGVFPSYDKLTTLVTQHFPMSKWNKTHWQWYKRKIRTGEIPIPGLLVIQHKRDRHKATKTSTTSAISDIPSKVTNINHMTSRWRAVKEIVEKLDAEPLTHLMLGHLELVHSNLLAWFFRCLQRKADAVFGTLTTSDAIHPGELDRKRNGAGQ
jgi:hypothetical protein